MVTEKGHTPLIPIDNFRRNNRKSKKKSYSNY